MFDSGIYLYLRAVNAIDIIIHYQKMAKEKFYVVWEGVTPGVYTSWTDCQLQIKGYEGAKYKSFETKEEATKAFEKGYEHYLKTASSSKAAAGLTPKAPVGKPIWESLCNAMNHSPRCCSGWMPATHYNR